MSNTAVTTGKVRFSYVHVLEAYAREQGQDPKYSLTVLVPKTDTDTKKAIDAAIEAATVLGTSSKWRGKRPQKVNVPIHDGDGVKPSDGMPFGDECKGHWVFTASSRIDYPPEVVDANLQAIISPAEVYSGCYGRVHINFFPYAYGGKKGIGCALNAVQKLEDGEPLAGRVKATDVFSDASPNPVDPITGAAPF